MKQLTEKSEHYVLRCVCEHLKIEPEILTGDSRQREVTRKRATAFLFMTSYLRWKQLIVASMFTSSRQALAEQGRTLAEKLQDRRKNGTKEAQDRWAELIVWHKQKMRDDMDYHHACKKYQKVKRSDIDPNDEFQLRIKPKRVPKPKKEKQS